MGNSKSGMYMPVPSYPLLSLEDVKGYENFLSIYQGVGHTPKGAIDDLSIVCKDYNLPELYDTPEGDYYCSTINIKGNIFYNSVFIEKIGENKYKTYFYYPKYTANVFR
jgi:hypothetical protein